MDKFKQFSSRLIFIAATVAGVVIGVLQFLYRAWHSNDVGTKLKSITYRMFSVLKTISTTIVDELETPSTKLIWKEVDDAEVEQKSAKLKRTRKQNAEPKVG